MPPVSSLSSHCPAAEAGGVLTNLWLEPIVPEICTNSLTVLSNSFYWVSLSTCSNQFLIGTQQVAWLHFTAISNLPSEFLSLDLDNIEGYQPNGTSVRNFAPQSGRLVIVGEEPLLECVVGTNARPQLVLYAKPGWTNEVQSISSFDGIPVWQSYLQTNLADLFQTLDLSPATKRTQFFRAVRY